MLPKLLSVHVWVVYDAWLLRHKVRITGISNFIVRDTKYGE